ncbi:unnamed protein product [Rodentolepis nana]|uniref:Cadherin cytoplasmic C-terminal domain-containing protein n=1 Tax=Rodentolepis nana TaxID=102285 RepID=A0A0R3TY82_RODNA|nr:unnamed protein product [Rodentolepis nana]
MGRWELWYQVMIFTVVAVCLTIIAFGVCLLAACYAVRLKAKAALLRRHQASHYDDMQFVDGGCLGSPGGLTSGKVVATDGLGSSVGMPIYLQRRSNIDYSHTLQRPPSVRSFSMSRPPTSNTLPSGTAQTPTDQPFIFSNGFNQQTDAIAWPTIYRSPAKGWGDFGFGTFTRAPPITTQNTDLDLSVHDDTLPTVNSPEVYTCRHDPYGYLSELHNQLADPIATSTPPVMNNMLTLRASTILSPSVIQPVSKSPIEVENDTLGMRKNDFQMAPAPPPSEFADRSKLSNGFDSWPKLNSATASILGQSATASIPGQSVISESANCSILSQSAISESATVHYFSLVRALSSLHLEVLNSLCSPVGYVGECHCFSFVRALISLHIEVGLSYNVAP